MMNSEYRRTWREIMRRGLALSLGLWMALAMWALPQMASAAFEPTAAKTISWFYAAAFSRTPVPNSILPDYGDLGGLTFWTNAYLAGEGDSAKYKGNLDAIGDFFTESSEFKTRYPDSMANEEYVTALYNNMLGRQPEGTLSNNFWVLQLDNGATRGAVLVDFANTPENQNKNPERKATLESYIAFINDDVNKQITPQEASVWINTNPTLDGKVVDKTLVITKAGTGTGKVTSEPPGIDCGNGGNVCSSSFSSSSGVVSVTLTAAPESGSTFAWGGFCAQDTDHVCRIEMSAARSVTATFSAIATTYTLTVRTNGTGSGTTSGGGNYTAGAPVTLTATPSAGSTFSGWNPSPCAASFAMPANNLTCTATFNTTTSQVGQPSFDKVAGAYNAPQPITITSLTSGAKIRVAAVANGALPPSLTCAEPLLNNEVQVMVDRSLTLYAMACLNGQPSEPMSATYTINNPIILNDTGITQCATNDSYGSDCSLSHPRFPGQDGDKGRDAWARGDFKGNITSLAKLGGGDAGFDFTKIDADGNDLPDTAIEWSCVRDNVTGLTWEVKTDDAGLQDKDWTYTWYDTTDTNGGGVGIKNGGKCYSGTGSCDTQGYAQAINRLGLCGRTDWRVPTSRELSQLVHYGKTLPAIDTEYFPHTTKTSSWAAETYAGDLSMAWTVVMSGGYTEVTVKGNSFARLQLVAGIKQTGSSNGYCSNPRIPATTPTSTFHDNQDGTVTHSATSLMWSRCALGLEWGGGGCTGTSEYHNWESALDEVATRNSTGYLGHNDWRLPNIKELNSITEHCRTNPAINTEIFPDASSVMSDFWSSSSLVGSIPTSAWFVDFRYGRVNWTGKSSAYQVLLVRDVQQ